MTQEQTWVLHLLFGLLPSLVLYFLYQPLLLPFAIFITGFGLGRERRDHELKEKLKASEWWKEWDIDTWSRDGKMDLVSFILFPWWFYIVSILPI